MTDLQYMYRNHIVTANVSETGAGTGIYDVTLSYPKLTGIGANLKPRKRAGGTHKMQKSYDYETLKDIVVEAVREITHEPSLTLNETELAVALNADANLRNLEGSGVTIRVSVAR